MNIIRYQAPEPLPDAVQERLATSTLNLQDYSVMAWATKSLEVGALEPNIDLAAALDHVRSRETPELFDVIAEPELRARQSAISATAALMVRFGDVNDNDMEWAWNVLARVETMAEPEGLGAGSHHPWHPGLHLVGALSMTFVWTNRARVQPNDSSDSLCILTIKSPPPPSPPYLVFTIAIAVSPGL